MIRTQIYLTKEEKTGIALAARSRSVSQSDLIRQAVDELLTRTGKTDKAEFLAQIAGLWSNRNDSPDLRELRAGWRRRPAR